MGLDNLKPVEVKVTLGGKEWEIRYPVRAFRIFQERFGGWRQAWKKLASTYDGDLDYDVLVDFLVIGINSPEATAEKVKGWVEDLYEDELIPIVEGMRLASRRWLPEVAEADDPQS